MQSETQNCEQNVNNGNEVSKSNTVEQHKISLMRSFIECRDPSTKEVDDLTLRRFLRARDLDVEKAGALFLKYLKWRSSFVPNGSITAEEIPYDLGHNKMFLSGFDKQGRPINVVFGGKHFQNPKPGGLDEFKRFCVYSLDKISSKMPAGQEKYLGIADLQGWGYSNSDVRAYIGVLSLLQVWILCIHADACSFDHYITPQFKDIPRSLIGQFRHRCLCENCEIFAGMLPRKIGDDADYTRPENLYDSVEACHFHSQIVFVHNRNLKSTLLEYIDEDQLPETYGGKMPLVPIQDA